MFMPIIRPASRTDLRRIRLIAEGWPEHFTAEGVAAVSHDAAGQHCLVAADGGKPVAFVVWLDSFSELEILWLATDPAHARLGCARRLIEAVESTATTQRVAFLKAASLDSTSESSAFDGRAYAGTYAFWEKVGYHREGMLRSFWDDQNHCVLFVKRLWRLESGAAR